jgi:preprotein translocase subunit SecG
MKLARTVAIAALTFFLLLLALSLFKLADTRWQRARNTAPGQFYLVYGKQMHLNCSGAGHRRSSSRLERAQIRQAGKGCNPSFRG